MTLDYLRSKDLDVRKLQRILLTDHQIEPIDLLRAVLSNKHEEARIEIHRCIKFLLREYENLAKLTLIECCGDTNFDWEAFPLLLNYCKHEDLIEGLKVAIRCDNVVCLHLLNEVANDNLFLAFDCLHAKSDYATFAYLLTLPNLRVASNPYGNGIVSHLISLSRSDFVREILNYASAISLHHFSRALEYNLDLDVIERIASFNDRIDALKIACRKKKKPVILLLMDTFSKSKNLLHHLVSSKEDIDVRDIIRRFVASGIDVNELCKFLVVENGVVFPSLTPLRLACDNQLTSSVIELLRLGANFDSNIKYDECNLEIQKALAANFHPSTRNLNNIWMLNYRLREQIYTLMLCRLRNTYLTVLPIELMEIIFKYL